MGLESLHGLLSVRLDHPIVAGQIKKTGVQDQVIANADD